MRERPKGLQPDRETRLEELLSQAPVFSALGPAERSEAAQSAVMRQYDKGEVIVTNGQIWPQGLLIASGTLRMVKGSASGRVLAAATLSAGQVFLGHSLFDNRPVPASLEAETPATCYLWDAATLSRLLRPNPTALWEVAVNLVQLMRRASDVIDTLAFQPLSRRLARLLLEAYGTGDHEPAPRTLTLEDMAARLGTTREVVCRLLYKLSDEDLIDITRTEFAFTDKARLKELADFDNT